MTPVLSLSQANNKTDSDILQNTSRCLVSTFYKNDNPSSTIICDGEGLEASFPDPELLDSFVSRDESANTAAEFLSEHGFFLTRCMESAYGLHLQCVYEKLQYNRYF